MFVGARPARHRGDRLNRLASAMVSVPKTLREGTGFHMKAEDVGDRQSLENWIQSLPTQNAAEEAEALRRAVAIANRAAMRVLPLVWHNAGAQSRGITQLDVLRACLVTGVAAVVPTPRIGTAASFAFEVIAAYNSDAAYAAGVDVYADDYEADAYEAAVHAAGAATFTASSEPAAAATSCDHAAQAVAAAGHPDAATALWRSIRSDCIALEDGTAVETLPLWSQNPLAGHWDDVRDRLAASGEGWRFWVSWYEKTLGGKPQEWDVLTDIALLPSADWEKGADHINALIAEIAERHRRDVTSTIQAAVAQNARTIPPQIDALVANLDAEIERLRGINPMDEREHEEIARLSGILKNARAAIAILGALVPQSGAPSAADAEKMADLLALYAAEFRKWPREHASELVDSTCRLTLVGLTAGIGVAFGFPALLSVAVGGMVFGGKALGGLAASIRDQIRPGSSG